jgi:serine/threonine-protein kinase
LRQVLSAKGRLPLATAFSIAIDLLDALDHAHTAGVIHRDVKPENIFLHRGPNEAHQTKLLDFGVMRLLSGDEPQTGSRFVGTLRYAPPEQLLGGKVSARTDLYAAGLVLYEMLVGRGPFDDETSDRGIANAHLHKTPPLLRQRIDAPPALEALVASALAKDPEARPRDAFAFAARLRALAREAAVTRGQSSSAGTVESWIGAVAPAPSATNVGEGAAPRIEDNGPTDVISRAYSRQQSTTLENAGPPTLPLTTLRLEPVREAIDRNAPTRTAALMEGEVVPDMPGSATTTGATESLAETAPARKAGPLVLGAVALTLAAAGGVGFGARWLKARGATVTTTSAAAPTAPPSAGPSSAPLPAPSITAASSPPSTSAPVPTVAASSVPTSPTGAPVAPTVTPRPPARGPRRPALSPAVTTPTAMPTASAPAKPRLPGPGF